MKTMAALWRRFRGWPRWAQIVVAAVLVTKIPAREPHSAPGVESSIRTKGAMKKILIVGLVAGLAAAFAGVAQSSPQALYQALLTNKIPDSQLPSGFYSSKTGVTQPSSRAKSHHVVGEVEIDLDSGDAAIFYAVFATPKDALANWKDADAAHTSGIKSRLPVPAGFPTPALFLNTSITGKNVFGKKVTNGVSTLGFVAGSVIVQAGTISTDNTDSGDVPGTISLAKLAYRHLRQVEVQVMKKH